MKFYFAPMEGITGYVYRNAHHTFFPGIDKYFSPFIVANQSDSFRTRELKDVLPEHNEGLVLIPQLLTNNAKDFIHASKKLKQLGYEEINFNLGCPSGTVVAKGRGSGFLAKRKELEEFLDTVFTEAITRISIKTRIGISQPDEFYELLDLYNKYPLKELIIHPRVQKDFYNNKPNLEVFNEALKLSRNPVCYNGDICTLDDYKAFVSRFPGVDTIMIGRGLITNPSLVLEILQGDRRNKEIIINFHDKLYEDYKTAFSGDKNLLFKMKELWFYMAPLFSNYEKYAKKIKKAERLNSYEEAVSSLFAEQDIVKG